MKKSMLTVAAVSLLSSTAFFLFPTITTLQDRMHLAICFFIFFAQIASIIFFLTSLNAFKKQLRSAYILFAIGILLFGLYVLQLPLVSFLAIDPLFLSWSIAIATFIGASTMYVAARKFATLLTVRDMVTSTWLVCVLAVVAIGAIIVMPHVDFGMSELVIDSIFGLFMAAGTINAVSAVIVLRIRAKLGKAYKVSLAGLATALAFAALGSIVETITKLLPFFEKEVFNNYYVYGFSLWPFLLAALFFMQASISFRRISRTLKELPVDASTLEVITYVAQLSSNPVVLDTLLDKVRQITALKKPGAKLSQSEENTLRDIYLEIEKYLVTKEPLRKISREELRSRLPEQFSQSL